MTDFPEAMDGWTTADWQEYRERIADGDPTTVTVDAIIRRRAREARGQGGTEVAQ
ncbi:hypothetical protein ACI2LJ_36030 [Streptomyces sp. NPDC088090]|uniref:hypothetical protein n=1 Tax=Streptomyces sp. NPDC088090 TaxID=3365822 RepID=UPI0038502F19